MTKEVRNKSIPSSFCRQSEVPKGDFIFYNIDQYGVLNIELK